MKNIFIFTVVFMISLFSISSYAYEEEVVWNHSDFNLENDELNSHFSNMEYIKPCCIGGYLFLNNTLNNNNTQVFIRGTMYNIRTAINPPLQPVHCKVIRH